MDTTAATTPAPARVADPDWVKVVEPDGSYVDRFGTRIITRYRVDLGGAPWDFQGRPV